MKTVSNFVYEAWLRSEKPLPYQTSVEHREIELLDPKESKDRVCGISGRCYLCGCEMEEGIKKKSLLGSSFTDHDRAKEPESDYLCDGCSFMILTNPNRRQAMRWFHYVASDTLKICNMSDLRKFLLNPPAPPFVISITLTQKKHLFYDATVNYAKDVFEVNMENEKITVWHNVFVAMISFVEKLLNAGMNKTQIKNGILDYKKIPKEEWEETLKKHDEYRKERMFDLAIFVAKKEEKE